MLLLCLMLACRRMLLLERAKAEGPGGITGAGGRGGGGAGLKGLRFLLGRVKECEYGRMMTGCRGVELGFYLDARKGQGGWGSGFYLGA